LVISKICFYRECPFDLKEATCSLIFASSRCGEFPELHKIQDILTSKFGKEFVDHAIKLHTKNGVNSEVYTSYETLFISRV
jgi:vacuolar protein sorting-associated protein IST1